MYGLGILVKPSTSPSVTSLYISEHGVQSTGRSRDNVAGRLYGCMAEWVQVHRTSPTAISYPCTAAPSQYRLLRIVCSESDTAQKLTFSYKFL
jgi:hypothetical protein